jgi:hypothetical protein
MIANQMWRGIPETALYVDDVRQVGGFLPPSIPVPSNKCDNVAWNASYPNSICLSYETKGKSQHAYSMSYAHD